jgi:peptide-methionine (S)-S-oxide reductase
VNQLIAPHQLKSLPVALLLALAATSCSAQPPQSAVTVQQEALNPTGKQQLATFGGGCFWCTEAVFERVKGVDKVVSGYAGGFLPNPTYKQVCTGQTGHAEVIQLTFDPDVIAYEDLLETLNRQGPDSGPQYRSVVFYHNDEQRKVAETYKKQLDDSKTFRKPIVTEISPFTNFYAAENYHQDFYELNKRYPYCTRYVSPKIKKFNRLFKDKMKEAK